MKLQDLKKLSHTHKVEILLLLVASVFNLSFGVEKLAQWRGIVISPLYWAIWYLTLGSALSWFTVLDIGSDLEEDCRCEEDK